MKRSHFHRQMMLLLLSLTINRQNRRRDRKPNHNIRVAGTSATDPIVIDDDDDEVDLRSSFPPIPPSSGFTSAQPQSRVVEGKSSGDDDGTVALTSARRHNKKRKRSPVPDSIAHPEASMEKSKPLTKRHKVSNGSMSEKSASSSAIAPASQLDDVIDVDKEEEEGRSIRLREISTLRARLGILEAEQAEHNERRLGRKGKIKLEPSAHFASGGRLSFGPRNANLALSSSVLIILILIYSELHWKRYVYTRHA
ncbi:hypothetical protein BT96DRAFT_689214 [Gymnopus androsaceus JB14]|uniref:Uncharacterized protein n=1 Tax=Gymnopus androsaceus JB14 TaxID=1447944 RepID=A0A6A4HNY0_9AGAR|nr:hypothetical protein BT96DRAFT_689214 [Gymnopus androsaceus JB14]